LVFYIGVDAGSVSVKLLVLDEGGRRLEGRYLKHRGRPLEAALRLLQPYEGRPVVLALVGSGAPVLREALSWALQANEVVAEAQGLGHLHPELRAAVALGGEDSKLLVLSERGLEDFSMNSVCAAGTGSFLDQQAERLRLSIEEFSRMAARAAKPARVAGRCSVFAKSDMIHLQQIATPVENIVAGLCFAVARNFKGTILRGRQMPSPAAFIGGVAANEGMVRAFREVLGLEDLLVPEDFALMGAWGAALKALREGAASRVLELSSLRELLGRSEARPSAPQQPVLISQGDDFLRRHSGAQAHLYRPRGKVPAYLGIDVGSVSTNLAVVDEAGRVLAKRYLATAGRPIEAVRQGLRELREEVGHLVDIKGVGTTGSGRYMIADFVGADIVKNEITAQATAAARIEPRVDTIFEIGGQDSKFISLRDGVIVDFEMNKACAAGTGSFLEEQAEKLGISIKEEFARLAFRAKGPLRLGERCTVFMENSLMANLQKGAALEDLLAGLAYSIVQNYINRVVAGKPIGQRIFFQGGVAFNKAVVAAFEKYLGKRITVPPHHEVTGAIGMALIAREHMGGRRQSSFKGFSLADVPYEQGSFQCKSCPNMCEINRVRLKGERDYLFYGGRCEKYDIRRRKAPGIRDLFALREELLWRAHESLKGRGGRARVGLPYVFFFHDQLPFWSTLLWEAGLEVVPSPRTNRQVVDAGLEAVLSEACFPVKVAHGHVKWLLQEGRVDAVLLPSFINLNRPGQEYPSGLACPQVQTIPYVVRVALEAQDRVLSLPVDLGRGEGYLLGELRKVLGRFGVGRGTLRRALRRAQQAQEAFEQALRQEGQRVLESLRDRAVVILGRAYNAFDRGMNLEIPQKLATLGVQAIPMDMLPLSEVRGLRERWPNLYWRSGQRMLRAARFIREHPLLYPILIGNFLCGPDSFILKYLREELGEEKPLLHVEIDEHSADAGAITRCEAFLDSIEGRGRKARRVPVSQPKRPSAPEVRRRVLYIPLMSDHAYALRAAFEACGAQAEVLPPSDERTFELGSRHVSGKECYPCLVTTGDMLKKVFEPGFEPGRSAFFMPSGTGPCRFGQYNVFHRMVLDKLGLQEVPIFAPNQGAEFYRELGVVGGDFPLLAWRGIVAVELLQKCLHESRPYEVEPGAAEGLYRQYLQRICASVARQDGSLEGVLQEMARAFQCLPRRSEARPLIGIVGEIFVRSNRFSNEDLVRRIEALGGEVWLAPVEEWLYYVNLMGLRKAWLKRDWSALWENLLKGLVQRRVEHKLQRPFEGLLKTLREPTTKEIIRKASPYVHRSFEGETILSIGKAVDLAQRGASGIINAMPFGCMPGTIVSALLRGISRRYGLPTLSIPFDGTPSSTAELQLEAFMEQARRKAAP
jgi:predicted CoA-substrate-specific enzyme activase